MHCGHASNLISHRMIVEILRATVLEPAQNSFTTCSNLVTFMRVGQVLYNTGRKLRNPIVEKQSTCNPIAYLLSVVLSSCILSNPGNNSHAVQRSLLGYRLSMSTSYDSHRTGRSCLLIYVVSGRKRLCRLFSKRRHWTYLDR